MNLKPKRKHISNYEDFYEYPEEQNRNRKKKKIHKS